MAGSDLKPQPGFQELFLSSSADIVIGGSGAGVGKTFAELLEAIRNIKNPDFGAVFFRRTYAQIKNEGGLWDQSMRVYPLLGGEPKESKMMWQFPSGATVSFSHLQFDKDVLSFQGSEIPLIIFDELTHFTEAQFWYMLSRNRSTCGVKPYVRASCNPDPDSFVARLIEWWIDQETGFPIPERIGKLRYMIRDQETVVWGDTKDEVIEKAAHIFKLLPQSNPYDLIKSVTFIPGSIYDNKKLLEVDPGYLANLLAQDETIKQQLLFGNWKVRQDNTSLFSFDSINDIFSNHVSDTSSRVLTCDAARFGRDLCIILGWRGWEVMEIRVIKQSDVHDIINGVEETRKTLSIQKSNCLIDQDGVGASTVKMGGYKGFSGGSQPKKVAGMKENYKNLKTQCYYFLANEKVNKGDIKINVTNENCIIDGVRTTKIKMGAKVVDIRDLIRDDLRAIKRAKVDMEGKTQINTKEEQKIILGRSPDFGDSLMMRSVFDIMPKDEYL